MERKDKIVDILKRYALSCGAFAAAYMVVTALFLVSYVNSYGGIVAMSALPFAFLLPFIIIPVVYSLMYRFNPLLFGRYHLVMPIAAIVAALLFVTTFSATEKSVIGTLSVIIGMTVFVPVVFVYMYCAFSVSARRGGARIGATNLPSAVTAFLGAFAAVGTTYGFSRYDNATMYSNSALVISAVCLIVSFVGYLATFNAVPVLGGKQVRPIKRVFVTFYGGIDRRVYFSALMLLSAFVTLAALSVSHTAEIGYADYTFAVAIGIVGAFALCYAVACIIWRRHSVLVALSAICTALSAILYVLSYTVGEVGFSIAASVLCGGAGAFALKFMGVRFLSVKRRVTSGLVFNLMGLTVCAAFAIALAVAAISTNVKYGYIYGFAFVGLAAIIAVVLHVNKLFSQKRMGYTSSTAAEPSEEVPDEENL